MVYPSTMLSLQWNWLCFQAKRTKWGGAFLHHVVHGWHQFGTVLFCFYHFLPLFNIKVQFHILINKQNTTNISLCGNHFVIFLCLYNPKLDKNWMLYPKQRVIDLGRFWDTPKLQSTELRPALSLAPNFCK